MKWAREDIGALPQHVQRQVRQQLSDSATVKLAAMKCRRCGDTGRIVTEDGGAVCPAMCASAKAMIAAAPPAPNPFPPAKRPWSSAKRCASADGTPHASKMERAVYERIKRELRPGAVLLRQVRMPLLSIAPDNLGRPLYLTVDFAIIDESGPDACDIRWVEAKGKRRSRDWARGKAAFEATWGKIEEVDR